MFVNFQKLPEESRIWVYGAEDIISSENQELISDKIFAFLNNWSHHGKPLTSSFTFIKNRFLIIGLDESKNPTGGCSMDTLQNLISDLDNTFKLNFYERMNVFVLNQGEINCIHASKLNHFPEINLKTLFYNLNIFKKGDMKDWIIPIEMGWCKRFLK